MAVTDRKTNTTITSDITVTARVIDFVTSFGRDFRHLQELLGISNPIKKAPGTALKVKKAAITLGTSPEEGDVIPYSDVTVTETAVTDITIEKYSTGVTLEAIAENGYDAACALVDDEFKAKLKKKVITAFYDELGDGTLAVSDATTLQMALAKSAGAVINKFDSMNREATGVVGFVNTLDFYDYLGAADITVQNKFGFVYVKDFLGYDTIFLSSNVPQGTVYATAKNNLVLYYIDPSDSDFARAGLEYATDGDTNLIGFHVEARYSHGVSEEYAIMGIALWAEYIDAIAVCEFAE